MEQEIDRLENARRKMLTGFLVAFVFWQIPSIARDALAQRLSPWVLGSCGVVAAGAAIVWMGYLFWLRQLQRQLSADPEAAAALDDERVRETRLRALSFGFWTLIIYLAIARLAVLGLAVPTTALVQLGLVVGVSAAIGSFLVLDHG